jgi:hypothetical protein
MTKQQRKYLKSMKNTKLSLFGAAGAMLVAAMTSQNAQANTIDFDSVSGGADIVFNGLSGFSFTDATTGADTGYSFKVQNSDMAGDSIGDLGTISGNYTIGAITISGATQSASVTGNGTLTIVDIPVDGDELTGNVVWENISTTGTGSTLNLNGLFNVTGVTYDGSQVDLTTLAKTGILSDDVTFSFNPGKSLTTLATVGGTTTYDGSISAPVPDGAMTVELLGGALLALAAVRRKMGC